ncbi:MAG TPA: hypothetical protein VFH38_03700 [Jatrophihabitans sp.]|nr:hypothetical protein [Jatrophihabitans sp.]
MTSDVLVPTSGTRRPPTVLVPTGRRVRTRRRSLPAGWPLTALLLGYPLWWVLGLAQVAPLLAAAVMAWQLRHRRRPLVVRGFGVWLLFLAWVLAGVFVLQLDAPGAVPGPSSSRYFTFAFRFAWYLAATVTAIYVYNMRPWLSNRRIAREFGWLFVTVTAGGLLGTLWPTLDFPSAVELLLPHHLRQVAFVHDTIHPVVAQLYTVDGVLNPRTSAPFAYTNIWGLNIACLLPFFCVGWLRRDAGWHRRAAPFVLLAAAYAIIESQNRGLWLALVMMVLIIGVRAVLLNRFRQLAVIATAGVVGAVLLLATPLGAPIFSRLDTASSNAGRANLGQLTLTSVWNGSPFIGFGTTRNVAGSFYSIAGGDTASCSLCTPPALGTQGQLWLVVFSAGIIGLLLYCWFLLSNLVRGLRLQSAYAAAGVLVITAHLATMVVYDSISMAEVSIFAAVGLIWRARQDAAPRAAPAAGGAVPLSSYRRFVRTNATLITVCVVLGAGAGFALQSMRGVKSTAAATILVPQAPAAVAGTKRAQSLDTVAALVHSPSVRAAVARVIGRPVAANDPAVSVTATPNTRLLQVHVVDLSPAIAVRAAQAAGSALLAARTDQLIQEQEGEITDLRNQRRAIMTNMAAWGPAHFSGRRAASNAQRHLTELQADADAIGGKISYLRRNQPPAGEVVKISRPYSDGTVWLESVVSGLMIGLATGIGIALVRRRVGRRVGRVNTHAELVDLPVLLRVAPPDAKQGGVLQTDGSLSSIDGATLLPAADEPALRRAAGELRSAAGTPTRIGSEVAIMVSPRTRTRHINGVRADVERCGGRIRGVVVIDERRGAPAPLKLRTESTGSGGRSK